MESIAAVTGGSGLVAVASRRSGVQRSRCTTLRPPPLKARVVARFSRALQPSAESVCRWNCRLSADIGQCVSCSSTVPHCAQYAATSGEFGTAVTQLATLLRVPVQKDVAPTTVLKVELHDCVLRSTLFMRRPFGENWKFSTGNQHPSRRKLTVRAIVGFRAQYCS